MKSSKWAVLNSALAVLAMGAGLLVFFDVVDPPGSRRSDAPGEEVSTGPMESAYRVELVSSPAAAGKRSGRDRPRTRPPSQPAGKVTAEPRLPEAIAEAFGWTEAKVFPKGHVPARRTIDAPWLSLIGSITRTGGGISYFFKNERTGGVLSLSPEQSSGGWKLEVDEVGDFLIARDGELYRVRRKR